MQEDLGCNCVCAKTQEAQKSNKFSWPKALFALITEGPEGQKRLSLGRLPLFVMVCVMTYKYALHDAAPPEGILTFIGVAFGYNGVKWFSNKAPKVDGMGYEQDLSQGGMK